MSSSSSDSSTSHAEGTAHPLFQVEDDDDDDSEGNTVWINDGERAIHISPERAKAEIARLLHPDVPTTTTTTTTTTPRYCVARNPANKRIIATAHELPPSMKATVVWPNAIPSIETARHKPFCCAARLTSASRVEN